MVMVMPGMRASGFVCALTLLVPTLATASNASGWYAGPVLNWITTAPGGWSTNDSLNAGIYLGYTFVKRPWLSLEGEYTVPVSEGRLNESIFGLSGEVPVSRAWNDWRMTTRSLYGVLRTWGEFYFKLRGGVQVYDVTIETESGDVSDQNPTWALGGGGGWRFGRFSVEADYTWVDERVDFVHLGLLARW